MRVAGTCHGHCVTVVGEAIVRLVFKLGADFLFFQTRAHTAALHHEAGYHAVKNSVVIVALFDIAEEIGDGFWRFLGIKLKSNDAMVLDMQFNVGV